MEPDKKPEPDWNSFETYKGPEEKERLPKWCYRVFDAFMILLVAAIVFAISGGLLFLASSRRASSALAETPQSAWITFCAGGCIGVGLVAHRYFRKS